MGKSVAEIMLFVSDIAGLSLCSLVPLSQSEHYHTLKYFRKYIIKLLLFKLFPIASHTLNDFKVNIYKRFNYFMFEHFQVVLYILFLRERESMR